ncbi:MULTISPECIES: FecCD family ABC transporter permease [Leclercia]|jgi:iron complex transport system permease protein|uniref:Iron ABC transporter permease n=2 Tax=Leclercia adecarboxylata TaxID=83655 RepID=A0A7H0FEX1_9ENTR|nr:MULTISPECIES: iron chelate uptake ABC transporter family permease subunit [Leclercia]MDU5512519.1 iron chelate uptake ABC transporter family permease subunit [Enterobacter sp.]POW71477.1 iron ABC transporter permease [Leclercia sp. LSNIH4]ALZ95358.1 ABC transporter permease [Leclercia adecarboxylata]AUY40280.1 iron ABC transporter permease [Leclercia sp. LSNIH3]KFC95557.1 permease component of an ABC superfamily iron siderophore transporter [Leclercia adecarboxylata ATCC 23216 = NBRC 102595
MTAVVQQTRLNWLLPASGFLAVVALLLVIAIGVSVGELSIPLQSVFYAITNKIGLTEAPLNRIYESVIWDFRLSRALVAACCGAGLAICGAVLQSLLKNALAEPYVLGVSAGASTGAVSVVVLGIGSGTVTLSAGAFAGAFTAFAFVALLTNGARGGSERTILAGVAASQLFNAITAYTISTSASAQQARDVMFWLLGSFSGVRWPEFQLVLVVMLVGLAVCLYYARALDAFTFGDDAAASLGIAVPWVRLILFIVTALMTATIVSMAGSIGFVGLVVPHVMRFFFGPLHRTLLIASALAGAILMVLADIASRLLIAPQSLPVGVVTALVGVPFFAMIIYRSRNK